MLNRESECRGKHCYMNAQLKASGTHAEFWSAASSALGATRTEEGVELGVGGCKIGGGCRINHRPGVNPQSY